MANTRLIINGMKRKKLITRVGTFSLESRSVAKIACFVRRLAAFWNLVLVHVALLVQNHRNKAPQDGEHRK